jgi:hypothetical protein
MQKSEEDFAQAVYYRYTPDEIVLDAVGEGLTAAILQALAPAPEKSYSYADDLFFYVA